MSTIAVNAITDASGGNTASINGATPTTDSTMGRNRIINGDMRIDQRNAGASVSNAGGSTTYALDRWAYYATSGSKFTIQQSSTAPDGFSNSMIITSSAATTIGAGDEYWLIQPVEGFNTADLNWGTSGAKTVTVSFWVRSSLTGTFGGSIINGAYNYSYPFSFSISAANTWEQKSVTITAPTAGTWVGATNGTGLRLVFSLAVGSTYGNGTVNTWQSGTYKIAPTGATNILETNGATFYITGVQLEAGSVATSFERRHYGQELALCQRYYWDAKLNLTSPQKIIWGAPIIGGLTGNLRSNVYYPVTMRADPTITVVGFNTGTFISGAPYANDPTPENAHIILDSTTNGNYAYIYSFIASAEL